MLRICLNLWIFGTHSPNTMTTPNRCATGTGNNVHAAEIIRTVLAKHSIRLEDEYLDGKDASMSTDVSLAVSEDMEWSVEEHLPGGGTSNEANTAHDGQHHDPYDPNNPNNPNNPNQTQAAEEEEWRRQISTLCYERMYTRVPD